MVLEKKNVFCRRRGKILKNERGGEKVSRNIGGKMMVSCLGTKGKNKAHMDWM